MAVEKIYKLTPTEADNALILGQAVHTGIEKGLEEAIKEYCFSYPIITDEHINEIIKLEAVIPKAKNAIPSGGKFEVKITDNDFIGYIDYLVPMGYMSKKDYGNPYGEGVSIYDIYDFKYSNNVLHHMDSAQLWLYKYFFEKSNPGKKIRNMYFLFVPKVSIKQKKDETLQQFRKRLSDELEIAEIKTVQITFNYDFNYDKVVEFLLKIKSINETTEFPKDKSYLCTESH